MNSSLASATLLLMVVSSSCVRTSTAPEPPPSPAERYAIVPAPRQLTPKPGELVLDRDTRIVLSDTSDRALRAVADLLVLPLRAASGLPCRTAMLHSVMFMNLLYELLDPVEAARDAIGPRAEQPIPFARLRAGADQCERLPPRVAWRTLEWTIIGQRRISIGWLAD